MPKETYEHLLTHIQEQEQAFQQEAQAKRAAEHQLTEQRGLAAKRLSHLKLFQAFSLGLLEERKEGALYDFVCQTAVRELLWDSAFVVQLATEGGAVLGSSQSTQKQLLYLKNYLSTCKPLVAAYAQQAAVSTYEGKDADALALSALFQTDEVLALPILSGKTLHGYLVTCSHSHRGTSHSLEDRTFLALLVSLVGPAVAERRKMSGER